MSGYRFCRTDDVEALVQAWNTCYRVHFPDLEPMTAEAFRRVVRELDLWTSSCMLAVEGDRPIGVLLAAKRETESLIHSVGIDPDVLRAGHGRHMLDSLGRKLAILGPPRIVAEVPAIWDGPCAFLEACGYVRERTLIDFLLHRHSAPPPAADFVVEIPVDDLVAHDALERVPGRAWHRTHEALVRRRAGLRALAIATDERIEAHLVYHDPPPPEPCEIVAFGAAKAERRDTLIGLLVQTLASRREGPLVLRRAAPDELPPAQLEALGFRAAGRTHVYAVDARAAGESGQADVC